MTRPDIASPVLSPRPELVLVTGLSGAGRSTAAKCLEDLGWYVIDNLPPEMLRSIIDLGRRTAGAVPRIAAVVDVRSAAFTTDLVEVVAELRSAGVPTRVLFLEAAEPSLVRRFEANRRPHPLQGRGRLVDGIDAERNRMRDLRAMADLVVDTTTLSVHELRDRIAAVFGEPDTAGMTVQLLSFGYKYGLPVDADVVVDCRFLPNPHWVAELRPRTGQDEPVQAYVLAQSGAEEFVAGLTGMLTLVTPGFVREGKHYLTVGIGCTGGKHRSVAVTEELGRRLAAAGLEASVRHRDLGRE